MYAEPRALTLLVTELDSLLQSKPSHTQKSARWSRGDDLLSLLEASISWQHSDKPGGDDCTSAISMCMCPELGSAEQDLGDSQISLAAWALLKLLLTPSDRAVANVEMCRRLRMSHMQNALQHLSGDESEIPDLDSQAVMDAVSLAHSSNFPPICLGTPSMFPEESSKDLDLDPAEGVDSTVNLLYLNLMLATSPFFVHCTGIDHIVGAYACHATYPGKQRKCRDI